MGHGYARRVGLENCKYDLVALMDSDDISLKNRFELQYKFLLNNPRIGIVGGQIEEFIGNKKNIVSKRNVPEEDKEIKHFLKYRCPFNQMTVMFYKDKVLKAGGYKDWYCNEDYYLWIRMYLNNVIFHNLNETLVLVRINDKLFTRRGGVKYFLSEFGIQKLLLKNKIINIKDFIVNVLLRFLIQIVLPNKIRKILFMKFVRNNEK